MMSRRRLEEREVALPGAPGCGPKEVARESGGNQMSALRRPAFSWGPQLFMKWFDVSLCVRLGHV